VEYFPLKKTIGELFPQPTSRIDLQSCKCFSISTMNVPTVKRGKVFINVRIICDAVMS
jgi:hypothetical protein